MQGTKDGLNNLEKKKNYGGFTFLHFKIYYKATLLGKKKQSGTGLKVEM